MRVLFWSELFWPYIGGVEVLAARLLPALQARGYEFAVVTRQDSLDLPEEDQLHGISIYRLPFWTVLERRKPDQVIAMRRTVAKLKRTFAPALVHINSLGPSVLFHLDTVPTHPTPSLVTLHSEMYSQLDQYDSIVRTTFRSATWVNACAEATRTFGRQMEPAITSRSSVIYNGVDTPPLLPNPLPFSPPRLLCLGRVVEEKGFALALTALVTLVRRFPQLRLIIAGDGEARSDLERQAGELGISSIVDFVGWVAPDKIPALLNTVTAVVMPSQREALPLVALEAALMARPVIATRVGGVPEVVVHKETGLLIEKKDSHGLAEAIIFLLEHPDTATRMGQAARRRAQEVFSWEQCVNAYDMLYQRLVHEAQETNQLR